VSTSQIRHVLNRFVAKFGNHPIDVVTHHELDRWLRSLEDQGLGPTSIHNHARVTRRFFNFARDWLEVVVRNPFVKIKERPLEHRDPEILTPSQMKLCLDAAAGDRRLVAFLCLAGFGGLRTQEVLRQTWQDIDWQHGEIFVRQPKRVGGWRPRHVEILDALRRHLQPIALPDGKVLRGGLKTLYQLRRGMMDKIGMDRWPSNCLRHSYKSYHYAFWQDGGKTAAQLGHAPSVSYYVYGTPVVKADASAWWKL
jgi:integrase